MDEDAIMGLISSFVSFAIFIGFFSYVAKFGKSNLQKKVSVFGNFKFEGQMPAQMHVISTVRVGAKQNYSNMIRMSERDRTLYIKLPFKLGFAIPFSSIKTVTIQETKFAKILTITLVGNPQPVKIWLNKHLWGQFPELIKFGEEGKIVRKTGTNSIKHSNQQNFALNLPKTPTSVSASHKNPEELTNSLGNYARAFVLIGALVIGGLVIIANLV